MFSDRHTNLVLTDYRMAEMNGHELLKRLKELNPDVMVILMTVYATVKNAVAAVKEGADGLSDEALFPG
jgi:DNA-binding NtrC family response regulator